jgi:hypothetical protein
MAITEVNASSLGHLYEETSIIAIFGDCEIYRTEVTCCLELTQIICGERCQRRRKTEHRRSSGLGI